ncbi:hypothetical protein NLJ89_g5963 [Agrocybe chaxingu]|uniref:Nucleolar 27S pre-rRNA processing Urb2/Npa2 C-terminal domain-containing protein n=1 Tax=Agrocybe chaxingu TaxID=84603 RepID=A0A9W8MV37_9AGAR|nr:hypothetical protein NLJ89_g5963 [Agrocybe chaxingu]
MHDYHLHRLSKALQFFPTEAQCLPMIQYVFDVCKTAWQRYGESSQKDVNNDSPKKKRKPMNVDNSSSGELWVVRYALVARLASVVLSSLAIKSLSSDTQEEVRTSLEGFRSAFIEPSISNSLKSLKKAADTEIWALEISLVANLRFLYALGVSRNLSLPGGTNAKIQGKMLSLIARDGQLPELTLELFRALFYCMSFKEESDHEETIDKVLEYLEKHFSSSHVHCSVQSYHLTSSAPGTAFAILHMVFDRWLPDVDRFASTEQLKRLLKIVMAINLSMTPHPGQTMLPEDLLMQILHSAQFWEFRNIRDVFVDLLQETTAPLDNVESKPKKTSIILEKASIYRLLLFFPVDYFSLQTLGHLIKCALQADFALTQQPSGVEDAAMETLTFLRVFLKRAYGHSVSRGQELIQSTNVLHFLDERNAQDEQFRDEFIKVTLDLIDLHFAKLLKESPKNPSSSLQNVLAAYNADIFIKAPGITSSSFTRMVGILTRDFSANRLYNTISPPLLRHISSITTKSIQQANISNLVHLVTGWHSILCLDKWLGPPGMTTPPCIGRSLAAVSIFSTKAQSAERNIQVDELCLLTHSILLQEVDCKAEVDREEYLDVIVAAYIAFAQVLQVDSLKRMDAYLAKICRKIALPDYTHLLSTVSDSLSTANVNPASQLRHLVQLASLLVREHPSHSLVHTQKFMTKCIAIYTGCSVFVEGPQNLRLQVLDMLAQHCSDQQAALRSLDVAGICLLISKFLAPSKDHDEATQPEIFRQIIMIARPLIRLRRDLVILSLPHLGLILHQLLLSLPTVDKLRKTSRSRGGKGTWTPIGEFDHEDNSAGPDIVCARDTKSGVFGEAILQACCICPGGVHRGNERSAVHLVVGGVPHFPEPARERSTDCVPPLVDSHVLRTASKGRRTTLEEIIKQYVGKAGTVLDISLPYESRPSVTRRPLLKDAHDSCKDVITVAHCAQFGREHKITLSSGFALNAEEKEGETLIVTCAHTLEEIRQSPLLLAGNSNLMKELSGTFVVAGTGDTLTAYPVSRVVSCLPISDLLLLSCSIPPGVVNTLPVSPYPAHQDTAIRAHFVLYDELQAGKGWRPWVGDSWGKWVKGKVLGYRDFAGRETHPGTYDALSHLLFTPLPTAGSSGGPIIDEENGSVVGVMLGSRMVSRVEGVRGWGVPSETIFEMFTLPGLEGKK